MFHRALRLPAFCTGRPSRRRSFPTRPALAFVFSSMLLAGCASIQGAPEPIVPGSVVADACPSDATVTTFDTQASGPGGITKAQWRDAIIGACIGEVDGQYSKFVTDLHEQSVSVDLGVDLLSLGLTGGAAIAGKTVANALSAASTGVIGAGAAINKDAFYTQTMPALVAQMNASRAAVYKNIRVSEQSDATVYTLVDAQRDIRDYEAAGTIDGAVSAITATAQQSKTMSDDEVQALFVSNIVDVSTQARKVKLAQYVKSLTNTTDKPVLDRIAAALSVTIAPTADLPAERHAILVQLDKQIVDQPSMDNVSALLSPITNQVF